MTLHSLSQTREDKLRELLLRECRMFVVTLHMAQARASLEEAIKGAEKVNPDLAAHLNFTLLSLADGADLVETRNQRKASVGGPGLHEVHSGTSRGETEKGGATPITGTAGAFEDSTPGGSAA